MYKIINTYIAGTSFDNEDGSSRKSVLSGLVLDSDFKLENYLYEEEKAVRVLTLDGKCVGNIPKNLATEIYDLNEFSKIAYVIYKPKYYPNGSIIHNIKIYIKD